MIGGFICSAALNSGIGSFDVVYIIMSALSGPASCAFLLRARQMAHQGKEIEKNEGTDGKFVGKAAAAFSLFAAASVFSARAYGFSVIELTGNAQSALPLLRTCATALVAFYMRSPARYCRIFHQGDLPTHPDNRRTFPLSPSHAPLIAYLCALIGGALASSSCFWIFAPRIAQCSKKPQPPSSR